MKIDLTRKMITLLLVVATVGSATAQTFSSGSTGADGALNLTTPGTIVFDPKTFNPPLDQDGDGIYHFTTITIGAGVTVKLRGDIIDQPVVWLAQGAVQINGVIDANGQHGFVANSSGTRAMTVPGSGGFPGGYPAYRGQPAGPGLGPAGGGSCGSYGQDGGFTANQFLVPLVGGSGGGGGFANADAGGAGGGAILISSSVSVGGTGSISARGGDRTSFSGAGAGGAIRLVAPSVTISGPLSAGAGLTHGACNTPGQRQGRIRIEAFQVGSINLQGNADYFAASPYGLYLTPNLSRLLRVVSVGGQPVPPSPSGVLTPPDVTINSNSPLPVLIEAKNVPVGTVITLTFFSENGPDQVVQSTPLAGQDSSLTTATANVTLPSGFSRGFLKATFTQP